MEKTGVISALEAMEMLAQRTKEEEKKLDAKIKALEAAGGEPNVITSIKVNGAVQQIDGKAVDIKVPTKTSDLENDNKFQTDEDVATAAAAAANAAIDKFAKDISDDDTVNTFKELVDYVADHEGDAAQMAADILKNADDISALQDAVSGKVDKVAGKQLSTEDFTTELKTKLDGITLPTAEAVQAMLDEVFGAE